MKITVDLTDLQKAVDMIRDYQHHLGNPPNRNHTLFDARTLLQRLLDNGVKEVEKHNIEWDGYEWVKKTEPKVEDDDDTERIDRLKSVTWVGKDYISEWDNDKCEWVKKPKADDRCDGCEFQHPTMSNMFIPEDKNAVVCNRGFNPPYYKDGVRIVYPHQLMYCSKYYRDKGKLCKFGEARPPVKDYLPTTGDDTERIERHRTKHAYLATKVKQHDMIITEILDMLIKNEQRKTVGLGANISTLLQSDAEEIKAKLGVKG